MPLRSRGPLLVGVLGLLGLWATGSGCQSDSVRHDAFAIRTKEGAAGNGAVAQAGDAAHHDAFAIRPNGAAGAPAASEQAVVMGTPIPVEPRRPLLTRLHRQPPAE